jgi:protein-L-isoaspartate O-methyltransferase
MNLLTFRELLSPRGQEAIAAAAALKPTEAKFLAAVSTLRKQWPADLATAALETVLLRERAAAKHEHADRFYFTRDALEMSSSDPVSRHRATRFARFGKVLDLCCGAGMDSIWLARAGCQVAAVDRDPICLEMAQANAAAAGVVDRIRFELGNAASKRQRPPADAAFADPSRRSIGIHALNPISYEPPVPDLIASFPSGFPMAVKIAPGVAKPDLSRFDAEVEFISSGGELKECVLWFGELKSALRRATVLPGGTLDSNEVLPEPSAGALGEYIFDPDPAVIRADLLGPLAEQLNAAAVSSGVALLTGHKPHQSPFANCYRVEACVPQRPDKLREYLQEHGIGRVTMLKRAADVDINDWQKQLRLTGSEHRHVILTRAQGRGVAIIAERTGRSATSATR